jgi:integrase
MSLLTRPCNTGGISARTNLVIPRWLPSVLLLTAGKTCIRTFLKCNVQLAENFMGFQEKEGNMYSSAANRIISESEMLGIIKSLPNDRNSALVALLASTGCHASEALNVKLGEVDVASRALYISPIKTRHTMDVKGPHKRRVYLSGPLRDYFFTWFSQCLPNGSGSLNATQKLFPGPRSQYLGTKAEHSSNASSTNSRLVLAMRRAGISEDITRYGLYCFRHMYCLHTYYANFQSARVKPWL